jgi:hypothetical protein
MSVRVTPSTAQIEIGETLQFQAVALNARREEISGVTFTWTSSDPGAATVSGTGLATGVGAGPTFIDATVQDVSGTGSLFVSDPNPPDPPSDLTARALNHTSIRLEWTDNSRSETGFEIWRAEGPPAGVEPEYSRWAVPAAGIRSSTDSELPPESRWLYRIRACNVNGCSPFSNDAEATTNGALQITSPAVLPEGDRGEAYAVSLSAEGGGGGHVWAVTEGTLPDGLSLSPGGEISGTPTGVGTSEFTIRVRSSDNQEVLQEAELFVLGPLAVTTQSLPDGDVSRDYQSRLESLGGRPPVRWTVSDGALPPGVTLDPETGALTGLPLEVGAFPFTATAISQDQQVDEAALSIVVERFPLELASSILTGGLVGQDYSRLLNATGGKGARRWSVEPGGDPLPTGLLLDEQTGEIHGRPERTDTANLVIRVTTADETATAEMQLQVRPGPLTAGPYLGGAYVGVPFQGDLGVRGGDGIEYGYVLVSGTLPLGMSLDPFTGEVSGTPQEPGISFARVRVESAGFALFLNVDFTVSTAPPDRFNMWARNVAGSRPSDRVQAAIKEVLARWEEIVVGDLPDWTLPDDPDVIPDERCGGNGARIRGGSGDDVTVLINIAPIDGPGSTLGFAGPCYVRTIDTGQWVTSVGILTLDSADLSGMPESTLFSLIWHEIGHVMGIGTLWRFGNDLLAFPGSPDPRYTGEGGIAGYQHAGGQDPSVPVANTGGSGTRDSHWRESTFDEEIMTGYSEVGGLDQPISLMTVLSLQDLGFQVDSTQADPFSISVAGAPGGGAGGANRGRELNDILIEPIRFVRADGSVIEVPRLRR